MIGAVLATCALAAPLSLEAAVSEALSRNEITGIARANEQLSEGDLRAAWAAALPSLTFRGTYTRRARPATATRPNGQEVTIRAANALNGSVSLTSDVFDATHIPLIQAAKDDVAVARAGARNTLIGFGYDVAGAFLEALAMERTLIAARERVRLAEETERQAQLRLDAGLDARNDVSRLALEVASARGEVVDAEANVDAARIDLGFLLGRPVTEELELPTASVAPMLARQEAEDRAVEARPDLEALRLTARAARRRASEPWLRMIPSIQLEGDGSLTNEVGFAGEPLNGNLSLSALWPLYDGGLRYADMTRRSAERSAAELELQRLERQVRAQVALALRNVDRARVALEVAKRQLDIAELNAEEVGARYRQGLASALERTDANVQLFSSRVGVETLGLELMRARLDLLRQAGAPPPGWE